MAGAERIEREEYDIVSLGHIRGYAIKFSEDIGQIVDSLESIYTRYYLATGRACLVEVFGRMRDAGPGYQRKLDDIDAWCERAAESILM